MVKEPCPFCLSNDLEYYMSIEGKFCIRCKRCKAQGPVSYTSIEVATEKWNSQLPKMENKSLFEQIFGKV